LEDEETIAISLIIIMKEMSQFDSGGDGLRTQSPSSSEFISIAPPPAGAFRGPAASYVTLP
jgi:hypothetical protein